jgi:hypothetical protein
MLILFIVIVRRIFKIIGHNSLNNSSGSSTKMPIDGFKSDPYLKPQELISNNSQFKKKNYKWKFSTNQPGFVDGVRAILQRSGWNQHFKLEEVDPQSKEFDISIGLLSRAEMEQSDSGRPEYYPDGTRIYFSRTWLRTPRVIEIDETNWTEGVKQSNLSVEDYRDYVINHEMGHALGYDHDTCAPGKQCPIMYQMTRGLPDGSTPGHNVTAADIARYRKLLG